MTQIEIINGCLVEELGTDPINSLTAPNTTAGRDAINSFQKAMRAVLSRYDFNCAVEYITLTAIPDTTPGYIADITYLYQFNIPINIIYIWEENDGVFFEKKKNLLYADSDTLTLRCSVDVAPDILDEWVAIAVQKKLASMIALRVTGMNEIAMMKKSDFEMELLRAKHKDAMESNRNPATPTGFWTEEYK